MSETELLAADQRRFDQEQRVLDHLASAGRPANVLEAGEVGSALKLDPPEAEAILQQIVDQQVSLRTFLRRRWPSAFSVAELAAGLSLPRERVEDLLARMPGGYELAYRGRRTGEAFAAPRRRQSRPVKTPWTAGC
jgi:hypothetical protein